MRLLIISDAWKPQGNGVSRLVTSVIPELQKLGVEVSTITPDMFRTVACPKYPEIRLAVTRPRAVGRYIQASTPDFIHIVTEGPLGISARIYCRAAKLSFTSALRTRHPEYLKLYLNVPISLTYRLMHWFHGRAERVMVSSEILANELIERGFSRMWLWPPGIDVNMFRPYPRNFLNYPRPIFLYVGRVAVEKNLESFLRLETEGTKVVVGDGPQLAALRTAYPESAFAGVRFGEELAKYYSAADVMVFPSKTDTFGLVMLEALACGTPVAAFDEPGPRAAVGTSGAACLDENLHAAIKGAMKIPRERCRAHALKFSWENSARSLLTGLEPCRVTAPEQPPGKMLATG